MRHDPDLLAQRRQRDVADVDAVDQDRAAGDIVEPRQQIHRRRLARAAQADQRDHLPSARAERDVPQHCLPRPFVIGKADVLELYAAHQPRQGAAVLSSLSVSRS